jgi:hypothetical protein
VKWRFRVWVNGFGGRVGLRKHQPINSSVEFHPVGFVQQ